MHRDESGIHSGWIRVRVAHNPRYPATAPSMDTGASRGCEGDDVDDDRDDPRPITNTKAIGSNPIASRLWIHGVDRQSHPPGIRGQTPLHSRFIPMELESIGVGVQCHRPGSAIPSPLHSRSRGMDPQSHDLVIVDRGHGPRMRSPQARDRMRLRLPAIALYANSTTTAPPMATSGLQRLKPVMPYPPMRWNRNPPTSAHTTPSATSRTSPCRDGPRSCWR